MDRETFSHLAERAARYPHVRRRGQLARPLPTPSVQTGFFAGLVARAAGYSGCVET